VVKLVTRLDGKNKDGEYSILCFTLLPSKMPRYSMLLPKHCTLV
jgi:hypothetical protein